MLPSGGLHSLECKSHFGLRVAVFHDKETKGTALFLLSSGLKFGFTPTFFCITIHKRYFKVCYLNIKGHYNNLILTKPLISELQLTLVTCHPHLYLINLGDIVIDYIRWSDVHFLKLSEFQFLFPELASPEIWFDTVRIFILHILLKIHFISQKMVIPIIYTMNCSQY